MTKDNDLAHKFGENRSRLKAVAIRILGSESEAEDAVQEGWMRLARSESETIENLGAWLSTVVARVCLDMLRARKSKQETPLDSVCFELQSAQKSNPENDLLDKSEIGTALLIVLDLLSPNERIAFVLHDLFEMPFEEIAQVLSRTPEASRQLASRARQKVKGAHSQNRDAQVQKEVVSAFLVASRTGDFEALLKILHPDIVLKADMTAVRVAEANSARGAPRFEPQIHGAQNVANTFKGKASAAQLAFVNGTVGATWAPKGVAVVAFCFTVENGKVTGIEIVMDNEKLKNLEIEIVNGNE